VSTFAFRVSAAWSAASVSARSRYCDARRFASTTLGEALGDLQRHTRITRRSRSARGQVDGEPEPGAAAPQLQAPDLAERKAIAADIQRQCWIDVPHLPVGIWYQPMAWQNTIDGIPDGFPLFWGVRRV